MVRSIKQALLLCCFWMASVNGQAQVPASVCDGVSTDLIVNCGFEGGTYIATASNTPNGNTINYVVPIGWTPDAGFIGYSQFNHTVLAGGPPGNYYVSAPIEF